MMQALEKSPHYCLSRVLKYHSSDLVIISQDKLERQKDSSWAQRSCLDKEAFNLGLVRQE